VVVSPAYGFVSCLLQADYHSDYYRDNEDNEDDDQEAPLPQLPCARGTVDALIQLLVADFQLRPCNLGLLLRLLNRRIL